MGTENLRALFVIDFDAAWAVGDSGTLLQKSGNNWNEQPKLGSNTLNSIHFFDAEHGAVGTYDALYLYNSGTWSRQFFSFPSPYVDVRAVAYTDPNHIFCAGTNGIFIVDSIISPLNKDSFKNSTNTNQTINSLYFLNSTVGYAAGDSGATLVTYDGGYNWAKLREFPHGATSMNFFSLAGHGASGDGVLNYDGTASSVKAIVRGRVTFGNPAEPIMAASVVRWYKAIDDTDTVYNRIDTLYTNEQGNFVFTDIDAIFSYEYHINFTDSGMAKTKIFYAIHPARKQTITLNYNDYTPPAPDTTVLNVQSIAEEGLSLDVSASGPIARITYSIPSAGRAQLIMQDVLGRRVRTISSGFHLVGSFETNVSLDDFQSGSYYITLTSVGGSVSKKIAIIR